ncbi:MAG: diacylglycerol/polyprenol kinase family protein [Promethearchaeota archaeon]
MVFNLFSENLAWLHDIGATILTLVVLLGVVEINGKIQKSGKLPTYVTRKIIHILAGPIFFLAWFFYTGTPASRYIAAVVPLLFVVQFAGIGLGIMKDEAFVRSMSRSGDPKELLKGTLYYAVVMMLVAIFFFYVPSEGIGSANPVGFIIIGCLAGGDGLADIIGRKFGGDKKFGLFKAEKTIAGIIAMFVASFLFSLGLVAIFSIEASIFNLSILIWPILIASIVATVAEALSPPHLDNLIIPVAVLLTIFLISIIIPAWWPFTIFTI